MRILVILLSGITLSGCSGLMIGGGSAGSTTVQKDTSAQSQAGNSLLSERVMAKLAIVLRGTDRALPNRGFVLQGRHAISIEILDAIPVDEVVARSVDEMTEHVRTILIDALKSDAPVS